MDDKSTGITLCNEIAKKKIFASNKSEIIGILQALGICGILESPEHRGYLDDFTHPLLRDTEDMRLST